MKRKVLLLILFFSLSACSLFSQDTIEQPDTVPDFREELSQRRTNVIKTNPIALFFGCIPYYTAEARLVNETVVSLYQSVYFGVSYLFKGPMLLIAEQDTAYNPDGIKTRVTGWRVQAGYKFYVNGWNQTKRKKMRGLAPRGLYFSPHISYATAKLYTNYSKSVGVYLRFNFFNVDLQAGYQLIAGKWFALDAFTGFGYMKNDVIYHEKASSYQIDSSEDGYFYNSNFKIVFGFNMGVAF